MGLNWGPGQGPLLQQVVSRQLATMFREQGFGSSGEHDPQGNSLCLGQGLTQLSIGSQLATAIYGSISEPQIGTPVAQGGPK